MITDDRAQFLLGPYGASNTGRRPRWPTSTTSPSCRRTAPPAPSSRRATGTCSACRTPARRTCRWCSTSRPTSTPGLPPSRCWRPTTASPWRWAKGPLDYAGAKGMQVVFNQQYPNGSTTWPGWWPRPGPRTPTSSLNSGHLLEAVAVNQGGQDLRFSAKMFVYSVGPTMPNFVQTLGKGRRLRGDRVAVDGPGHVQAGLLPQLDGLRGRVPQEVRHAGRAQLPGRRRHRRRVALERAIEQAGQPRPGARSRRAGLARRHDLLRRIKFERAPARTSTSR